MKVLPMRDKTDKFTIKKKEICSLPTRTLMFAPSGFGKSSLLGWLLCMGGEKGYKDNFEPENIYIFSGSYKEGKGDFKLGQMIRFLDIPEENIFDSFDNDVLNELYDMLVEDYNDAIENKEKPKHTLIIMDDLGFTNKQNKTKVEDSALDKIFCNGRKFLVSSIILNQRIIQVSPTILTQANNIILFKPNNRDLEAYEKNFNYMKDKKSFKDMVRDNTEDKHSFMVIDFTKDDIYRDRDFQPIKIET